MILHELYGVIHIPRLKDENAADLFLGFGKGAVGNCDFAVLPTDCPGEFSRLKPFTAGPMAVGTKIVVVFKACIEHGVSLTVGHSIEVGFVVVTQTNEFHCPSPMFLTSGLRRQPVTVSCNEARHFLI